MVSGSVVNAPVNLSLNLKPLRIKNIRQNIMEKLHMSGLVCMKDAPHRVQIGQGVGFQMGWGPNRATLP